MAFVIPFVARAVPEVLMGSYPTGFDTVAYYIPNVYNWMQYGVDPLQFVAGAPLFYCILMLTGFLGLPIVPVLKVVSPLLHGLLGFVIYVYARRGLGWSGWKSLSVCLLGTLYFVALRVSWDMLRLQLGLIFLFVSLTLFHSVVESRSR